MGMWMLKAFLVRTQKEMNIVFGIRRKAAVVI